MTPPSAPASTRCSIAGPPTPLAWKITGSWPASTSRSRTHMTPGVVWPSIVMPTHFSPSSPTGRPPPVTMPAIAAPAAGLVLPKDHRADAGEHQLHGGAARPGGADRLQVVPGRTRHLVPRDVGLAAVRLAEDARVHDQRAHAERAQPVAD